MKLLAVQVFISMFLTSADAIPKTHVDTNTSKLLVILVIPNTNINHIAILNVCCDICDTARNEVGDVQ